MGPVKDQRAVRCGNDIPRVLGQGKQIADGALNFLQQRMRGSFIEQIDAGEVCGLRDGRRIGIQLPHEVSSLTTPGGQQWVSVEMHVFKGRHAEIMVVAPGLAAPDGLPEFPSLHDVGLVKTTGIEQGHQHLAVMRQGIQDLQG